MPSLNSSAAPGDLDFIRLPGNSLLGRALRQDPRSVTLAARGFTGGTKQAREVLDTVAGSFISGFNLAIGCGSAGELHERLLAIPSERRGFAYEGAGMACAILDILTPYGGRRVAALLSGRGDGYVHLIHVGTGWGFARLRLRPWRGLPLRDPMLRWLAWDGWGFHQGFFSAKRTVSRRRAEPGLGAVRSVRDQGLGRSLWFHDCASVTVIGRRIEGFPADRRPDLWSGAGLAAAYAGGVSDDDLARLATLAGPARAHLVQGVAFAAAAHLRGGCLPEHTRRASAVLAGVPAETAAEWTGLALAGLTGQDVSSYQTWRARIREHWSRSCGTPAGSSSRASSGTAAGGSPRAAPGG